MGRLKSGDTKLTERIAVRVTSDTKNKYSQKLKDSGLSCSEFFRFRLLSDDTEIFVQQPFTKDSREALRLLKNVSNNCNQIAHALNTANLSGLISEPLVIKILEEISRLVKIAKEVQTKC